MSDFQTRAFRHVPWKISGKVFVKAARHNTDINLLIVDLAANRMTTFLKLLVVRNKFDLTVPYLSFY